jgi:HlyD family secretion protein
MNIRGFFTKKKIIWTVIILVVAGFVVWKIKSGNNPASNINTDTVKRQNIKSTVLATGQVVSSTDLELSFKSGGVVSKVNVKEGDKVKAGSVLATLSQNDQAASLTQAQGALAQAQANLQKVLAGASSEDITVAQVTLDNANSALSNTISQQKVLVDNAYSALLNSTLTAVPFPGNAGSAVATVSGTYKGTDQGIYNISIYSTGSGAKFNISGLETGSGDVQTVPVPLGTKGLYIQFSSSNVGSADQWNVKIPNTQAASYVANYNSYQAALQTQNSATASAQNAVTTAQAALDLKKSQARPADIASAQAQILIAQGQVQAAQSALENTIIRAPADGTITSVDIKVGEQASPSKEVLILQDVGNLHIEANVSEANIASIKSGQTVDVTFDALGPDRHFNATVQTVNPASTVVSGVVNYKVTAAVDNISEIKPGMTANMTILVAQKDNVLAVPSSAVINQNNNQYVRVVDDIKKGSYHQVQVQTGLSADGGLVEIVSGLNEGQTVVTYIKQ